MQSIKSSRILSIVNTFRERNKVVDDVLGA
jgi:hypothetical protein